MVPVRIERLDDVALIVVDNPPVNALSQAVRAGLVGAAEEIDADPRIKAAVLVCDGRTFISGADIREMGKPAAPPSLLDVVDRIERIAKPVIAAIHGQALGGGFEIALACHYRIAQKAAKVGLPEVNLGIIPGAGGCVRLPRAIGVEAALEMIADGEALGAEAALAKGAIDRVAGGELREAAIGYARELVAAGAGPCHLRDRPIGDIPPEEFFARRRAEALRKAKGRTAPGRAVDAVAIAVKSGFDEAAARTRDIFIELRDSPEAAALRHIFFAEREVARAAPANAKPRPIASVGVIGAGAMGAGIAAAFADAGHAVTLIDMTPETVGRGLGTVRQIFEASFAKGRIDAEGRDRRIAAVAGGTDYELLRSVDLVVEAAFESLAVKKEIFVRLDAICRPGAILATNTSYLGVGEIATAVAPARRGDVLGLHFFNPAHVMKLLEIVEARETAAETLATAVDIARRIGKTGVVSGDRFGFIGNRMLNAYRSEALRLSLDGAGIAAIDRALEDFGLPLGPFALMDLTGLDINVRMRRDADPALIDGDAFALVDRLFALNRLGRKSGAGFYTYAEGSRAPVEDPEVDRLAADEASRLDRTRREDIAAAEIVERCLLALVNEGARILDEGVARRSSDIDVVYVAGYGFPRHLGGPMFWAEQQGLAHVLTRIRHYQAAFGPRWWAPAASLVKAVENGGAWPRLAYVAA